MLRDLKYCCKTHGYLYSSKVNKDDIDSFEMEIKPIGDDIKAFLKLEYNTIRDGVSKMAYKQYVGTPYKINLTAWSKLPWRKREETIPFR